MLFTPSRVARMWDTWLYYHEGTHYLFFLHNSRAEERWDGISLATSADGVHFVEQGPILERAPDATWLGSGMTWRAGDRFLLNFSEERNGVQEIFFAESYDLRTWRRVPDVTCRADPRWYAGASPWSPPRWDCIWVLPREDESGYVGFLTAVANEGPPKLRGTAGVVLSTDGLHFQAAPPAIAPGDWSDRVEVGAVEKVGDRYYLLLHVSRMQLGARHVSRLVGGEIGTYVLESERQLGPYRLGANQHVLLGGPQGLWTYFARFYRCGNSLLLNHHTAARRRTDSIAFAPLKAVQQESTGALTLCWWRGNEALRGPRLPVNLASCAVWGIPPEEARLAAQSLQLAAGSAIALLPATYDTARGLILEADLALSAASGPLWGGGLFVGGPPAGERAGEQVIRGTLLLAQSDGWLAVGTYDGATFRPEHAYPLAFTPQRVARWRLLLRGAWLELYVDDTLVLCTTLTHTPSGRLGWVVEASTLTVRRASAWAMGLD